jgi:hypothetical protein
MAACSNVLSALAHCFAFQRPNVRSEDLFRGHDVVSRDWTVWQEVLFNDLYVSLRAWRPIICCIFRANNAREYARFV